MTVEIVGGQKALPFLPFPVKYKTAAGRPGFILKLDFHGFFLVTTFF